MVSWLHIVYALENHRPDVMNGWPIASEHPLATIISGIAGKLLLQQPLQSWKNGKITN